MYYAKRLTAVNSIYVQVNLLAKDLKLFFCMENDIPSALSLVDYRDGGYVLKKQNGEVFVGDGFTTFYGLPNLDDPPPKDLKALVDYVVAYTIYQKFFLIKDNESFMDLENRLRGEGFPRVFDPIDVVRASLNRNPYFAYIMSRYASSEPLLSPITDKMLVLYKELERNDSLFIGDMEELDEKYICRKCKIVDDFHLLGNIVVIPNLSLDFTPTHFLRCSVKFASLGNIFDIPLQVNIDKPIEYNNISPVEVGDFLKVANPFKKYELKLGVATIEENSLVGPGTVTLSETLSDDVITVVKYGYLNQALRSIEFDISSFSYPKLTFDLTPENPANLYIEVDRVLEDGIIPQQLATSGIEDNNNSWLKVVDRTLNKTIFTSAMPVYVESATKLSIGWRFE